MQKNMMMYGKDKAALEVEFRYFANRKLTKFKFRLMIPYILEFKKSKFATIQFHEFVLSKQSC